MKVRRIGLLAAVAMFAAVPTSAEADSGRDRATGGGQLVLDPNNTSPPGQGAFDTLAFTAQRARGASDFPDGPATGQVQVNRRIGSSSYQVKFHGIVECLVVVGSRSEGKAYISGYERGTQTPQNPDGTPFELWVNDGGSGADERIGDQAMLWYAGETGGNEPDQFTPGNFVGTEDEYCGIEEDPTSKADRVPALARGNFQVYDANPNSPTPPSNSMSASARTVASKSLTLAALR